MTASAVDNSGEVGEMEKIMVVAGIWIMCALCAVAFVRGASTPALRRVRIGRNERPEAEDCTGR